MKRVKKNPVVLKGHSTLYEGNVELLLLLVLCLLCIIWNNTLYCLMLISHHEHSHRDSVRHGSFEARTTCEWLLWSLTVNKEPAALSTQWNRRLIPQRAENAFSCQCSLSSLEKIPEWDVCAHEFSSYIAAAWMHVWVVRDATGLTKHYVDKNDGVEEVCLVVQACPWVLTPDASTWARKSVGEHVQSLGIPAF